MGIRTTGDTSEQNQAVTSCLKKEKSTDQPPWIPFHIPEDNEIDKHFKNISRSFETSIYECYHICFTKEKKIREILDLDYKNTGEKPH